MATFGIVGLGLALALALLVMLAPTFVATASLGIASVEVDLEDPEEIPVQVQLVNRNRVRRSRHISPLFTSTDDDGNGERDSDDFEYHLKIKSIPSTSTAFDSHSREDFSYSLHLHLRPLPSSPFSPGFKYTQLGRDPAGNTESYSFVPSRNELDSIEAKLYTDAGTKSFVKLEQDEATGELELHGVIDGARIRTRRDSGSGSKSHSMSRPTPTRIKSVDVTKPKPKSTPESRSAEKDYMLFPPKATLSRRTGAAPLDLTAWVNIEPELAFVFDYQLSQDIGGDWARKLEYAAITLNGINGYYELTNDSIRISCELVHLVEITSEAENPYPASLGKISGESEGTDSKDAEFNIGDIAVACVDWLPKNKALLGSFDIAPIFVGVKISGTAGGLSPLAGACELGPFGVVFDTRANFEGIILMAHEIGHNLGASHDGDPAVQTDEVSLASTEACPFSDGFLMGYDRRNYTNSFRFSQCSLNAIKQFVTTDKAACLRPDHKTGRPPIIDIDETLRTREREADAGNGKHVRFDRDKSCAALPELNFQGISSYAAPDEQCRVLDCEAKINGVIELSESGHATPRGAPCGNNERKGVCRNGFCIGQGPAVDMDSVCRLATRFGGSRFDSDTTRTPLESICDGRTPWSCLDEGNTLREFNKTTVIVGTPCGGTKVCFNKQCVEKAAITDPNKECILETGKEEAVHVPYQPSNPKCAGLMKCVYGTEHEFIGAASTDPACSGRLGQRAGAGDQLADNTHTRVYGSPGPTGGRPEQEQPRTLKELCDRIFGSNSTRIGNVLTPGPNSRDELCSNLLCIKVLANGEDADQVRTGPPDGTICGPLRRCKQKKCAPCGRAPE